MNRNTEWQDRLPNPETQTPPARSRWQAEWIRAITGNRIQGLIGHLQEADGKRSGYVLLLVIKSSDSKPICKKPMASEVDQCNITRVPLRNPSLPSLPVRSPL